MKITPDQTARLAFLARVTEKACQHLHDTDDRLFGDLFTVERAQKIEANPILAERLDAFVSRFGSAGKRPAQWPRICARAGNYSKALRG